MVMTVPSVKVLHGSPRSCLETSIPPKSCLCGCRSQRLHNSALLEPTGDSCLHSSMMLAVQKPEVSLLPHAFLPSPFLKCAGRREIAAMQNFCTKSECCATRWNLHSVVSEMAFFVDPGHYSRFSGFTFLVWVASALRELQCLLDLPLGNTKWVGQACLLYHLKYDLGFPIISD